ncbi:MAG: hypothetical protein IPN14_08665 [Bacteroidetes bacterium]|nr:hypothetical protein [Bacteroidota bacterium]
MRSTFDYKITYHVNLKNNLRTTRLSQISKKIRMVAAQLFEQVSALRDTEKIIGRSGQSGKTTSARFPNRNMYRGAQLR